MVCESTYASGEEDVADSHFHMTSRQAAKIAKDSNSKSLTLVHLSQRYDTIPKVILKDAKEIFKDVIVAEDLDIIEL